MKRNWNSIKRFPAVATLFVFAGSIHAQQDENQNNSNAGSLSATLEKVAAIADADPDDAGPQNLNRLRVPKLNGVEIDGRDDDWGEAGFRIDLLFRVEKRGSIQPRGGTPIRLGWDDGGLLVLLRHEDDRWVEATENPWRYDSVEFYIADPHDRKQRYQVVIAPGMSESTPEPVVAVYDHRKSSARLLEVDVARKRDGETAVIEARLPWAHQNGDSPTRRRAAFQVMVNDNDEPGSNYGKTRHNVWYPKIGAAQDPKLMRTLHLGSEASRPFDTHVWVTRDWPAPATLEVAAASGLAGKTVRLLNEEGVQARAVLAPKSDGFLARARLPLAAAGGEPARIEINGRVISDVPARSEHPFLICTREQFPMLRARAEREPWKTMAAAARNRVEHGGEEFKGRFATGLQRYIGAAALLYILDEDERRANAEIVRDAIARLEEVEFDPKQKWAGTVSPMGAAFVAILALDIVHDDLAKDEVVELGSLIKKQIGKINPRGAWVAARLGTHGTWELFKNPAAGGTADFWRRYVRPFYRNYLRQMTPDGVNTVSPGYAFARLASGDSRPQKTAFADVLEFTGIDQRYYDNPKLENFYRWLFGYSVTPAKEYHLFGDVGPNWGFGNSALCWRVGRFDQRAAAYAAWLLEGKEPPGHILSYILTRSPLPEAIVPQSRLFMKGEAVFREPEDSPMSLGAALYNITEGDEFHTHEEVNAISLAAYGNNLVVNGGWLGDDMRPPYRNNTLAIDGERHQKMTGAGLTEGLTSYGFDYAVGDSGNAMGDDAFERSLILVHGTGELGGYFITLDEVNADPGESVHHYLQLASTDSAEAIEEKRHYRAAINHHAEVEGVSMDVFFAVDPNIVEQDLLPSGLLERVPSAGKHYRLKSVFPTDEEGNARLLTVLFPEKEDHSAADLRRVAGERYRGITLGLGHGVTDAAIMSAGKEAVEHDGAKAQARLAVFRTRGNETDFYFTRLGHSFRRGDVGFESDEPISIHMAGKHGSVTSNGATVMLHQPEITGISLNGEGVEPIKTGNGWLRVKVPKGRYNLRLIAN